MCVIQEPFEQNGEHEIEYNVNLKVSSSGAMQHEVGRLLPQR
jgi:hypothetical protein